MERIEEPSGFHRRVPGDVSKVGHYKDSSPEICQQGGPLPVIRVRTPVSDKGKLPFITSKGPAMKQYSNQKSTHMVFVGVSLSLICDTGRIVWRAFCLLDSSIFL